MTRPRKMALFFLLAVAGFALLAPLIAPYPYDRQFRDFTSAPPSALRGQSPRTIVRERLHKSLVLVVRRFSSARILQTWASAPEVTEPETYAEVPSGR